MDCKYLIIGNSAGGIAAAEAIRETDKEGTLIMVSLEKHQAYSRALIPYYIANKIELDKMYCKNNEFYNDNINVFWGKRVERLDFEHEEVELEDGERINYEKLLIATGSAPFMPPIEGLRYDKRGKFNKENVFTFTSLDDAIEIKRRVDSGLVERVIVLGGGRIGLMAAEALLKNGLDVTLIKRSREILPEVFDKTASRIVKGHLRDCGLPMIVGHTMKAVKGIGNVEGIVLDDGTEMDCDLLIIATGIKPRTELANDTPVKLNRGILVDRRMRTSVTNVYACGDCAEVYDFVNDDFRLIPLWSAAYAGGRVAGFNMCGLDREYNWGTNMNSIKFFGLPVLTAGLSAEEDGYEVLKDAQEHKKIYRKLVLRNDRIVGMNFINKIDRAGIFLGLMETRRDVSSFKEDLLDPDFGLASFPSELTRADQEEGRCK